jgi:hypothetical protein
MAYEKTWSFSFDNAHTPANALDLTRYELWALKAMLLGQLGTWSPTTPTTGFWTHYGSSDSVTAGIDGTDRWLATYDGTKIVRGSSSAIRSWWVGRSPATMNGQTFYMCLSFDGTGDPVATIVFAKTAFTGGSITARPTSVDEWISNAGVPSWNAGNVISHRYNMGMTSDGSWYYFVCRSGAVGSHHDLGIMCMAPIGCNAGDNYPIYTHKNYSASALAGAGFQPSILVSGSNTANASRISTGTAAFEYLPFISAITGTGLDIFGTAQIDLPCWVIVGVSAGNWHARGRLPDISYIPAQTSNNMPVDGYTYREAGNITAFTCGGFLLPGNSVPNFT